MLTSPPIDTVLFDMDGTLIDTAPSIAKSLGSLVEKRGGCAPSVADVRRWVSLGAAALVAHGLGRYLGDPEEDLTLFRAELLHNPPALDDVYPHVFDCLAALAGRGIRMAVVTNKPEAIARDLNQKLGLAGYFSATIGGDTVSRSKPDPAPILEALARLGGGGRAIFVGDSAVDGHASAAAGLAFYLFEGGYGAADCADRLVWRRFQSYADLEVKLFPCLSIYPPAEADRGQGLNSNV